MSNRYDETPFEQLRRGFKIGLAYFLAAVLVALAAWVI